MFGWFKRKNSNNTSITDDGSSLKEAINEVTGYIERDVASGFADLNNVVDRALEVLEDEHDIVALRPHAESALNSAIANHLKAEQTWPEKTDCDRFDMAYASLEDKGVVCRHNFSCCGTCASAEIWDEIQAEQDKGREIIGCAHYHEQDTESAVEGYGVYLSYGSVLEGEQPSVDIGLMIAHAMREQGLEVTWDETLAKRIHVKLDWKRRLAKPDA
ncbi:DUF6891 domain-containing protein [Algisphaera agarilytica]|uniref:DUF6891 domain-containing protein n=1 Tax=Algisphaera agarilytica TaxID=1385975 RepID=A0A7X0H990_9BACT|nr:hypothetical protein [Algisphaera agarilytica]MBB6431629.1 hypothetical protein [Algisphaera agarilytica]